MILISQSPRTHSLTSSRHDHDTTDPETELCDIDMATLISALRSEMRNVVGEFRLSDKPD